MPQLAGKIALVTGANRGIGRATALTFAREGATVIVAARDAASGEAVVAEAMLAGRESGGSAMFVALDVAAPDRWPDVMARILDRNGRLDIAMNNAGISGDTNINLADQSDENFDKVIDVNLKGTFLAMRAQIAPMVAAGGGSIINMSSIGGLVGSFGLSPYIASKHAIIGLTRAAAIEYARQGLRVNAIAAGGTATKIMLDWLDMPGVRDVFENAVPFGRLGLPEEIANAALWLASDAASFVSGAVVPVDGGYTAQ